ncbi:MAG: orotate phosphoribosyltransferase [bacterium]
MLDREEILDYMRRTGALQEGHFILTSGRHSDRYFQCARLLQHPGISDRLTDMLADPFRGEEVDTVVSPAVGGILAGQGVARALGVRAIFTERRGGEMVFRRGFFLEKGERVLVIEDVVTTGGSVREVLYAVREAGAEPAGVGILVDRSPGGADFGIKTVSLIRMEAESWDPERCPLCEEGDVPAVKPGSRGLS